MSANNITYACGTKTPSSIPVMGPNTPPELSTASRLTEVGESFCPCLAVIESNPGLVGQNITVRAACNGGRRLQEDEEVDTSSLRAFLGPRRLEQLQKDLDELGVEEVADFKELEQEEIDILAAKLKKAQARKLVKKIAALH